MKTVTNGSWRLQATDDTKISPEKGFSKSQTKENHRSWRILSSRAHSKLTARKIRAMAAGRYSPLLPVCVYFGHISTRTHQIIWDPHKKLFFLSILEIREQKSGANCPKIQIGLQFLGFSQPRLGHIFHYIFQPVLS